MWRTEAKEAADAARGRVNWVERLSTGGEGGEGRAEDTAQIGHRSVPSFIL